MVYFVCRTLITNTSIRKRTQVEILPLLIVSPHGWLLIDVVEIKKKAFYQFSQTSFFFKKIILLFLKNSFGIHFMLNVTLPVNCAVCSNDGVFFISNESSIYCF